MEGEERLIQASNPVAARFKLPPLRLHVRLGPRHVACREPTIHLDTDLTELGEDAVTVCCHGPRPPGHAEVPNDRVRNLPADQVGGRLIDRARLRAAAVGAAQRGEEERGVRPLMHRRFERKLGIGMERRDHRVRRDPPGALNEGREVKPLDGSFERFNRVRVHGSAKEDPVRESDLMAWGDGQHARWLGRNDRHGRERQARELGHALATQLGFDHDRNRGREGGPLRLGQGPLQIGSQGRSRLLHPWRCHSPRDDAGQPCWQRAALPFECAPRQRPGQLLHPPREEVRRGVHQ